MLRAPTLLLLLSLALAATMSWSVSPPDGAPQEDWANRIYPRAICAMEENRRGMPLANGRSTTAAMAVSLEHVAAGDSNANGRAEALVFLKCRRGKRTWHSLLVYEAASEGAGVTLVGSVVRAEPIAKVEVVVGGLQIAGSGSPELYRWSAGALRTDAEIAARAEALADGTLEETDREVLIADPAAAPASVLVVPVEQADEPPPVPEIRAEEPPARAWEPAVEEPTPAPESMASATPPPATDDPGSRPPAAVTDPVSRPPTAVADPVSRPPTAVADPVSRPAPVPPVPAPAPSPAGSVPAEAPAPEPPAALPSSVPASPPVATGLVKWLENEGELPPGAVSLYRGEGLCAVTEGGFELGVHRDAACELGSGNVPQSYVLMGAGRWLPGREAIAEILGLRDEALVEVGTEDSQVEQVCRVVRQGRFRVGLVTTDGCLHIVDGESRTARTYDVLVVPRSPTR